MRIANKHIGYLSFRPYTNGGFILMAGNFFGLRSRDMRIYATAENIRLVLRRNTKPFFIGDSCKFPDIVNRWLGR